MKISELKKEAKIKLNGIFKLAVGINLIHLLITLALSYVSVKSKLIMSIIMGLVTTIIAIPLNYGLLASMLKLSRKESVEITDFIKIGFQNFKKAFFLYLSICVRLLIPIILMVVLVSLPVVEYILNKSSSFNGTLSLISLILMIPCMLYIFYKILSYVLCTYILIDNPEKPSKDIIKKSCELMYKNKIKYIGLILSFFGWFLLCGIVSGTAGSINELLGNICMYGASLLLTPYITFSEINFYEDLAKNQEEKDYTTNL